MKSLKSCCAFLVLCCAFALSVRGADITDPAYSTAIAEADRYLSALADEKVIGGIAAVQKEGKIVFARGYGYAVEEFLVPFDPDQTIHIGSNTKLFTTAAIFQLAERGLLNISDPVNSYIDPKDFGLNGTWCPLIHGREEEGCQEPTFEHMMGMSSGALPTFNTGCGDGKPGWNSSDWRWPYRLYNVNTTFGFLSGDESNVLAGTFTTRDALNWANWMKLPFQSAPGESYCYVNNNFVLMGYFVEKLSKMSLADYITENIIKPANLTSTYVWSGQGGGMPDGLRLNDIIAPGYYATFDNKSAGPPTFQSVRRLEQFMPSTVAIATQGTGDQVSSVGDVLKWYSILTSTPEVVGLTKDSVDFITSPHTRVPVELPGGAQFSFGQGIGVVVYPDDSQSTSLAYTGNLWGTATSIRFWENLADISKADGVTFFSNYAVAIPPQADGTCAITTKNGTTLTLDPSLCKGQPGQGVDFNTPIINHLADLFNVTSTVPGDNALAPSPSILPAELGNAARVSG